MTKKTEKTLTEHIGAVMEDKNIGFAAAVAFVKDKLKDTNGVSLADGLIKGIMEEKETDFAGAVATIEDVLHLSGQHPGAYDRTKH